MRRLTKIFAMGAAMSAALLMGSALTVTEAQADGCSEKQDEAESGGKNYKTVTGADGRKVFVIEKAFVVCGKVPRPNVIYVLQATAINYEWENLKQDFLPKIRQSVKKAPF
jgi:hypothetical protein